MPDENGKSKLEWVVEPHIQDGKVVYRYRNAGDADATLIGESVHLQMEQANEPQMFQLPGLAVGAEQETHAPMGHNVPDGDANVNIQIQSARDGQNDWDSELLFDLKGHGAGGRLVEGAAPTAEAETGTLHLAVPDVRLEDDEVAADYRIEGDAQVRLVAATAQLLHAGQSRWMSTEIESTQHVGTFRFPVPLDLVDGGGWRLELYMTVASTQEIASRAEIHMDLVFDNGVVTAGAYAIETDAT